MKGIEIFNRNLLDCYNATYADFQELVGKYVVLVNVTKDQTKIFKNIKPSKIKGFQIKSGNYTTGRIVLLENGKKYSLDFEYMEFFDKEHQAETFYNSEITRFQKIIKDKIQHSIDLYNDMEGFKLNTRQNKLERLIKD